MSKLGLDEGFIDTGALLKDCTLPAAVQHFALGIKEPLTDEFTEFKRACATFRIYPNEVPEAIAALQALLERTKK